MQIQGTGTELETFDLRVAGYGLPGGSPWSHDPKDSTSLPSLRRSFLTEIQGGMRCYENDDCVHQESIQGNEGAGRPLGGFPVHEVDETARRGGTGRDAGWNHFTQLCRPVPHCQSVSQSAVDAGPEQREGGVQRRRELSTDRYVAAPSRPPPRCPVLAVVRR